MRPLTIALGALGLGAIAAAIMNRSPSASPSQTPSPSPPPPGVGTNEGLSDGSGSSWSFPGIACTFNFSFLGDYLYGSQTLWNGDYDAVTVDLSRAPVVFTASARRGGRVFGPFAAIVFADADERGHDDPMRGASTPVPGISDGVSATSAGVTVGVDAGVVPGALGVPGLGNALTIWRMNPNGSILTQTVAFLLSGVPLLGPFVVPPPGMRTV